MESRPSCSSASSSMMGRPSSDNSLEKKSALKAWKKSIMLVYNQISSHKHAHLFRKPVTEEQAPFYHTVIKRPMDLSTIKKNIETGNLKTTVEFQRDVMLMFQNAVMYNNPTSIEYQMATEMQSACLQYLQCMVLAMGEGVPQTVETDDLHSSKMRPGRGKRIQSSLPENISSKKKETSKSKTREEDSEDHSDGEDGGEDSKDDPEYIEEESGDESGEESEEEYKPPWADLSKKIARRPRGTTASGSKPTNIPTITNLHKMAALNSWKRSLMLIYNKIASHKHAHLFLKPVTEEQAPFYHTIIKRPMDLSTIKKNIEAGNLKTTEEFQRDVLLMFQNAVEYNEPTSIEYQMATEMQSSCMEYLQTSKSEIPEEDSEEDGGKDSKDDPEYIEVHSEEEESVDHSDDDSDEEYKPPRAKLSKKIVRRPRGTTASGSKPKNIPSITNPKKKEALNPWKRSIMLVYNEIASHKHAHLFLKPVTEKQAPLYHTIIKRPMDLSTIKKNIKTGNLKTTEEFQRDIILMFQNAVEYNNPTSIEYQMATEMQSACLKYLQSMVLAMGEGVPQTVETDDLDSSKMRPGRGKRIQSSLPENISSKKKETSKSETPEEDREEDGGKDSKDYPEYIEEDSEEEEESVDHSDDDSDEEYKPPRARLSKKIVRRPRGTTASGSKPKSIPSITNPQ